MPFDEQKSRFQALDNWFNTHQGLAIADFFTNEISHVNGFLHGETLLQLGSCGKNPWLQSFHYIHKWLATFYQTSSTTFLSAYNQLPIDRDSVDCIIAPLVLDAYKLSRSPIDEIDRVLKPMGYVIFFGINPFSLWGLHLRMQEESCYGPLKARAKSIFSVQRAMVHRGYVQSYLSSFYYIPPVSSKEWLDKLEILNELGKMISPCPAGFYCLIMQKQQEITPNLLLDDTVELWKSRLYQPGCLVKKA
ncbi:MAG: methyltransferase domain-containing protein [Tatlockia sp.]|nr:methyltransferase domain-containing protein [Tatlockia sp.]